MTKFALEFWGDELYSTKFELGPQLHQTTRGACFHGDTAKGTFHWTRAVKAMCIVVIQSKIDAIESSSTTLKGLKGSPALSLDYAICKEPTWLLDMFGTSLKGVAVAKRIFLRYNSNLRRPGPVMVALNKNCISTEQISIFREGAELTTAEELKFLRRSIYSGLKKHGNTEFVVANKKIPCENEFVAKDTRPALEVENAF